MEHITELCASLDAAGVGYAKEAPLRDWCTFRIGGPAALIATPAGESGLISAITEAEKLGIKYTIIGNGSNILFSDEGYDGMIISTVGMKNISVEGEILTAGCGATLGGVSLAAARAGLAGLEFAYGIPGTCGGGVFMNAGAYGSQLSDVLRSVVRFDADGGGVAVMEAPELELGYRRSVFMEEDRFTVLSATLVLKFGDRGGIESRMREIMGRRRDKQPLEYPSAGSVFKRRDGYFMGQIIEESGLKGYKIGGAAVSEKHAGFIINTGGATAGDVLTLIEYIKSVILKNYGFEAECEIRYVGA